MIVRLNHIWAIMQVTKPGCTEGLVFRCDCAYLPISVHLTRKEARIAQAKISSPSAPSNWGQKFVIRRRDLKRLN